MDETTNYKDNVKKTGRKHERTQERLTEGTSERDDENEWSHNLIRTRGMEGRRHERHDVCEIKRAEANAKYAAKRERVRRRPTSHATRD